MFTETIFLSRWSLLLIMLWIAFISSFVTWFLKVFSITAVANIVSIAGLIGIDSVLIGVTSSLILSVSLSLATFSVSFSFVSSASTIFRVSMFSAFSVTSLMFSAFSAASLALTFSSSDLSATFESLSPKSLSSGVYLCSEGPMFRGSYVPSFFEKARNIGPSEHRYF